MTEPTSSDKLTNLIAQSNTLEKFLLFMVTGLTIAVIVLGVQLSNAGNRIDDHNHDWDYADTYHSHPIASACWNTITGTPTFGGYD